MNWVWLVEQGLIKGDPAYYEGSPSAIDVNNAIVEAYKNSDDDQRKRIVDMVWEGGNATGDKAWWYENQSKDVQDLAAAYSGVRVDDDGTSASSEGDAKDGTGPRMSLPGNPALWKVGNESWIVYETTGTDGEAIRVAWKATSEEDVQSFFGPDQPIVYDQAMDALPADVLNFGSTDELGNLTDDPITTWRNTLATESKTQPWLLDTDYQALSLMAVLEGRPLSDSEIQQTEFWKTHTDSQRKWMKDFNSDPMSAQQALTDQRGVTRQFLIDAGINNASDELVEYMADQLTTGEWSETYYNNQSRAISDPASGISVDTELEGFVGEGIDTTQAGESEVRGLVKKWLGPTFGEWDESTIADWAGKIRNDPDAQTNLVEQLKDQKMAMYSGYDRESSYETIAQPWRGFVSQMWGTTLNETDPLFDEIINLNDSGKAGELLTKKGLERGNDQVVNTVQTALNQSFGGTAR